MPATYSGRSFSLTATLPTHTITGGDNWALVELLSANVPSAGTYNGSQALTLVAQETSLGVAQTLWVRADPSASASTPTFTGAGTIYGCNVVSGAGADTASIIQSSDSDFQDSTGTIPPTTGTVSSNSDGVVLSFVRWAPAGGQNILLGSGPTQRWGDAISIETDALGTRSNGASSVGATSVTHSWQPASGAGSAVLLMAAIRGVSSGTPPSITDQPDNTSVAAGATANFSITATGTGLTYQWQRSTNSGGSWANVTTGTGGTTASYTTAATTVSGGDANNGDQYRCVVTGDTAPPATSTAATLTVTSGAPDAPNTLARTLNPGSVDLTWVLPGTGATRTGVRVERRNVTAAGAYGTLASLGASAVNYSDTTALGGINWRYRVIAFNGAGDSGPSNEVDADYSGGGGGGASGGLFGGTLVRS